jgi:Flp pilus assembly protein TadD/ketosteroid isomerase-like protein
MSQSLRSKAAQWLAICAVVTFPATTFLAGNAFGADDLTEANKLMRQGQYAPALEHVDTFLATNPRDAQGRFLRGLILTEQGKTADAIGVFSKLTEDYPELPEPYNNLAVLYASQGQYEKAKTALEMAIRTHPSYGTAHENLGDIYAKLASQAYGKALQLDSNNTTAQSKLAMIRELITLNMRNQKTAGKTEPAKVVASVDAPKPAAAKTDTPAKSAPDPVEKPAATPPVTTPPVAVAPPATTPAPAKTPATPVKAVNENEEIVKTLKAWAAAWSAKDVSAYLGFYAAGFKTPGNQPRAEWENARKLRIQAPKTISVALDAIKVRPSGDSTALVSFHQNYKSDTLKNMGASKTVVMTKAGGKWQILEERVGG